MSKSNGATRHKNKAGRLLQYLSKSSNTTVSGTISLKPATASSSVTTSAPKQSESGVRKVESYTSREAAGQDTDWGPRGAVPLTGDVGALPAAAAAARGGLRRLKVAGFADREVNLTT